MAVGRARRPERRRAKRGRGLGFLELDTDQAQHRLDQCDIDEAADAEAFTPQERSLHRAKGIGARHHVGDHDAGGAGRAAIVLARQHRHVEAGHRVDDRGVGGVRGQRPVLAEAGDGAIDQSWAMPSGLGEPEPKPIHNARAEVLHHHVGPVHQAARGLQTIGGFKIERDTLLASIELGEDAAHPVHDRRCVAKQVALADRLDLDHLGHDDSRPHHA